MYRRHLKHSRVKNLFKFVSSKMNTVFTVESSLEFDTCFHLEYSSAVKEFETQPLGYYYEFEGRACPYTPDFRVVDHHGNAGFIEVKPCDKVAAPDFLNRFPFKQQKALVLSSPLKLITERQIRIDPILGNLKLLHRYSGFQSFTPLHTMLLRAVREYGRIKLSSLCDSSKATHGAVFASVLTLIAMGLIKSDLTSQAFGANTIVWTE